MVRLKKIKKRLLEGGYLRIEKVKVKGLPAPLTQISDIHYAKLAEWIKQDIRKYLASKETEILCVTGDLVDKKGDNPDEVITFLDNLPVDNIVVSFGNHDEVLLDDLLRAIGGSRKIKAAVSSHISNSKINFVILPDINFKRHNSGVYTSLFSTGKPNIVLAHNPQQFWIINEKCKAFDVPLIMSGHTHGGQIFQADLVRSIAKRLTSNDLLLNTFRVNHEHDCFQLQGSYKLGKMHLHINVGLATHTPGRFGCPPTITEYIPA